MQRVLRRAQDEDGFTLVELMVVVMIMAILIVMGLPTFLGVKGRFQDRAAESEVRNTVLSARILFTDSASYVNANATPGQLDQIDSSVCYVAAATPSVSTGAAGTCVSGTPTDFSVSVLGQGPPTPNPNLFAAARMSSSSKCILISDTLAGTFYGTTTTPADCTASYAASGALTATTPTAGGW